MAELLEEAFLPADLRCIIKVQYFCHKCCDIFDDEEDHDGDGEDDADNQEHRLRRSFQLPSFIFLDISFVLYFIRPRRSFQLATTSKGFFPPHLPTATSSISHRHCDNDDGGGGAVGDADDLAAIHLSSLLPCSSNSRKSFHKLNFFKVYYLLYQVSYYDKLLDACESAATKRGRTPFIREVGSQPVTVKLM